jgi:hypothetical protein
MKASEVEEVRRSTTQGRKFVIFAGSFNQDIGGVVALHKLCDMLRREGHDAYLWPETLPKFELTSPFKTGRRLWRYHRRKQAALYKTWPGLQTPIAHQSDLREAIVVYPEVIDGNPLRAKHVVRWLLHKPGFHTKRINFGPEERFFFYLKAFDDPSLNPDGENLLRVPAFSADFYRQTNFGERHGTCYLMRKGKGRKIVHDLKDSVLVDGMSHAETAQVFNRVQTFISYDTYTLYSVFAALCGCVSIVIPDEGVTKAQWFPDPRDRCGLAYGFDDIEHAVQTRHLLQAQLQAQEEETKESVRRFAVKCAEYFPV